MWVPKIVYEYEAVYVEVYDPCYILTIAQDNIVEIFNLSTKYAACNNRYSNAPGGFNILLRLMYTCKDFHNIITTVIFPSITEVTEDMIDYIKDYHLLLMPNIQKIGFYDFSPWEMDISDVGVQHLTKLTILDLECLPQITDFSLTKLTNLRKLSLGDDNDDITDNGLSVLTGLTNLDLFCADNISDSSLRHLTNLKKLWLHSTEQITDASLSLLTSLERLNLAECTDSMKNITNKGLSTLTNLTKLFIDFNYSRGNITDETIDLLTNLTKLRW